MADEEKINEKKRIKVEVDEFLRSVTLQKKRIDSISHTLRQVEEERKNLKSEIMRRDAIIRELKAKQEELEATIHAKEENIVMLRRGAEEQRRIYEGAINDSRAYIQRLSKDYQNQISYLNKEREELLKKLSEMEMTINKLNETIRILNEEKKIFEEKSKLLQEAEKKNLELEGRIDIISHEKDELLTTVKTLKENISNKDKVIERLKADIAELVKNLRERQEEYAKLQEDLLPQDKEFRSLKIENEKLRWKIEELERTKDELQEVNNSLKENLKHLNARISTFENENSNLLYEIKRLNSIIEQLQKEKSNSEREKDLMQIELKDLKEKINFLSALTGKLLEGTSISEEK